MIRPEKNVLGQLFVDPPAQGSGVGSGLLTLANSSASASGICSRSTACQNAREVVLVAKAAWLLSPTPAVPCSRSGRTWGSLEEISRRRSDPEPDLYRVERADGGFDTGRTEDAAQPSEAGRIHMVIASAGFVIASRLIIVGTISPVLLPAAGSGSAEAMDETSGCGVSAAAKHPVEVLGCRLGERRRRRLDLGDRGESGLHCRPLVDLGDPVIVCGNFSAAGSPSNAGMFRDHGKVAMSATL